MAEKKSHKKNPVMDVNGPLAIMLRPENDATMMELLGLDADSYARTKAFVLDNPDVLETFVTSLSASIDDGDRGFAALRDATRASNLSSSAVEAAFDASEVAVSELGENAFTEYQTYLQTKATTALAAMGIPGAASETATAALTLHAFI